MASKSDIEMARLAITKVTRAEVRLKYALLADRELNDLLPKRLAEFDAAIQEGEVKSLTLKLVDGNAGH
jgi:hypothetical protein